MDSYGIEQARLALGEIVDKARLLNEPTCITRHGKPAAVVISTQAYDLLKSATGHEWPPRTARRRRSRRGEWQPEQDGSGD